MRQSRPKNGGRSRVVGGSWVKSVFAHFDNLKSLLGSQNALWYWLVVNEGILTVKNKFHVFASLKMMILYVIRGVGGKFLSLPV